VRLVWRRRRGGAERGLLVRRLLVVVLLLRLLLLLLELLELLLLLLLLLLRLLVLMLLVLLVLVLVLVLLLVLLVLLVLLRDSEGWARRLVVRLLLIILLLRRRGCRVILLGAGPVRRRIRYHSWLIKGYTCDGGCMRRKERGRVGHSLTLRLTTLLLQLALTQCLNCAKEREERKKVSERETHREKK